MGIQGLLPFLKKSSRVCNLSEFKGQTVAIDAYCWLHKGAFACAEKLVKGEPTDGYILYVMKQVNMLLSFNIKPILVFDGCHLPSKSGTEKKRRENRAKNRQKAKELLREGKIKEARECFQRCVDVTSSMACDVIKACRAKNIDTIVAPYEADAELAFLNQCGIADIVITEDSDLVIFGCSKIIFKMDSNGGGMLIEKENLHLSMNVPRDRFCFEKFRNMCILSGCDYLPSLHGIGLVKACRFFNVTSNPDVFSALTKLPSHLKMPQLQVNLEYREGFIRAINTVLYQLVFDPSTRTLRPLTPYPPNLDHETMPYCGERMDNEKALQIALGNMDIQTFQLVDDYKPSPQGFQHPVVKSLGWNSKIDVSPHPSIWQTDYLSLKDSLLASKESKERKALNMVGKEQCIEVSFNRRKRPAEPAVKLEKDDISENDLENLYSENSKKLKYTIDKEKIEESESSLKLSVKSPELERELSKKGVDEKYTTTCISEEKDMESKLDKKISVNPFAKKSTAAAVIVRSRYFVTSSTKESSNQPSLIVVSKLDEALSSKNAQSVEVDTSSKYHVLHEMNVASPTTEPEELLSSPSLKEEHCHDNNSVECSSTSDANIPHFLPHKPSIFDTPPSSQNKENLSRFFCKLESQSGNKVPAFENKSELQNSNAKSFMTFSADRNIQAARGHQLFSTPKSSSSPVARKSLPNKTSNKCRVPGLRKTSPLDKQKQLNLRDMFGYKKEAAMTYKN